mgnify:CR=1 FL=1
MKSLHSILNALLLTLAAAEEGKPHKIRVNAVAPGKGDTAMRAAVKTGTPVTIGDVATVVQSYTPRRGAVGVGLEKEGIEVEEAIDLPLFVYANQEFLHRGLVAPRLPDDDQTIPVHRNLDPIPEGLPQHRMVRSHLKGLDDVAKLFTARLPIGRRIGHPEGLIVNMRRYTQPLGKRNLRPLMQLPQQFVSPDFLLV